MNNYTVGKLYIRKYFGCKIIFVVAKVDMSGIRIKILKNCSIAKCGTVFSVHKRSMKVA